MSLLRRLGPPPGTTLRSRSGLVDGRQDPVRRLRAPHHRGGAGGGSIIVGNTENEPRGDPESSKSAVETSLRNRSSRIVVHGKPMLPGRAWLTSRPVALRHQSNAIPSSSVARRQLSSPYLESVRYVVRVGLLEASSTEVWNSVSAVPGTSSCTAMSRAIPKLPRLPGPVQVNGFLGPPRQQSDTKPPFFNSS